MSFTTISVPGTRALDELEARRQRYAATGEYPFLIGGAEEVAQLQEILEVNEGDPGAILEASSRVDLDAWIAGRRTEAEEYDFSEEEILGDWPRGNVEKGALSLHREVLSRKVRSEVHLGITTIERPWHLLAALGFGGWNECPDPEVHTAFHRHWGETHGAEIAGVSGDVVECLVQRPPRDRDAALHLAWQQYWYCPDIVEQGCEAIQVLAATLLNAKCWYFWWD